MTDSTHDPTYGGRYPAPVTKWTRCNCGENHKPESCIKPSEHGEPDATYLARVSKA